MENSFKKIKKKDWESDLQDRLGTVKNPKTEALKFYDDIKGIYIKFDYKNSGRRVITRPLQGRPWV